MSTTKRRVMLGIGTLLGVGVGGVLPIALLLLVNSDRLEGGAAPAAMELDAVAEEFAEAEQFAEAEPLAMKDQAVASKPMRAPSPVRRRAAPTANGVPTGAAMARTAGVAAAAPAPQGETAAARQWFPESLLWAPRVKTDAQGLATLEVKVPDQLTTWRVLGLAHDAGGQQAGAVHTFDARLPLYVDPVFPGWLYAGDEVQLPVQVVNTTPHATRGTLKVEAEGAVSGRAEGQVALAGQGSAVRQVAVRADGIGAAQIRGVWTGEGAGDEAIRSFPVQPAGRPVQVRRAGTVVVSRALDLAPVAGADPLSRELEVRVFPGPLAVLQAEVERVVEGRVLPVERAYGFALASRMEALGARTGVAVSEAAVRRLQILAWQRIAAQARHPSPIQAAYLLLSLRGVEGHALVDSLRPRLVHTLIQAQRGDGTWSWQGSSTLQHVLVQTALSARALPEGERGARLRAEGAIERHHAHIDDPYTAAVILAAGLARGELKARLMKQVMDAVEVDADGTVSVSLPPGIRGSSGMTPSRSEVLAWVALAVEDPQLGGDLVAQLMGSYTSWGGLGAGVANGAALDAVLRWMPALDGPVDAVVLQGGQELARAKVDPAQPRVPAHLLMPGVDPEQELELRIEPPSPGLAFVAELTSYVPWTAEDRLPGVEVELRHTPLSVGSSAQITLSLVAPSGEILTVEQGLPAGAKVDEAHLEAQVRSGSLHSYQVHTDRVRLTTHPLGAGQIQELQLSVQPVFAGRFQTVPLTIERRGLRTQLPPMVWEVQPAEGA